MDYKASEPKLSLRVGPYRAARGDLGSDKGLGKISGSRVHDFTSEAGRTKASEGSNSGHSQRIVGAEHPSLPRSDSDFSIDFDEIERLASME